VLARGRDHHHHYPLLPEPPTATTEEGLPALAEFARRRIEARLGRTPS